jgi:hypothetical protein
MIGFGLGQVGCAGSKNHSTAEYRQKYDKPLLSPGAQFAALPPAAQNTVRAETGSAEISNIVKTASSRRVVYRVYFENGEHYPPLNVGADGSLLDRDMTLAIGAPLDHPNVITGALAAGVTLNDLPTAVIKAIQRQVPNAEIDTIMKEAHRDQTSYLISFKDHQHPTLHLASDGTVL